MISRAPNINEETIATIISNSSERFINENKLCIGNFKWQDSCSAFSVSKSDVDRVCKYILNQKEHHKKQTYAQEYGEFIKFYERTIQPIK